MRDCAQPLPHVLRNVERISELYDGTAAVFVENDSRDGTKEIVWGWCRGRPDAHLVTIDGLDAACPVRTMRLALARAHYLAIVRSEFSSSQHLVVMDCDGVNARPLNIDALKRAIAFLDSDPRCAGVFANQDGPYYDLWALRHPGLCPGDVWEEVLDCVLAQKVSDQKAFAQTLAKRMFSLPLDAPPLVVHSAFGGLGIYKIASVLRNPRGFLGHKSKRIPAINGLDDIGWQTCEHVSFNMGFGEQGERLFVLPFLVNAVSRGFMLGASAYREKIFDLRLADSCARVAERLERSRLRGATSFAEGAKQG